MTQGYIVSLEGIEGGGKSTQLALLQARLEKMGKEVVAVREPGGSDIAEQIRNVVLSPANTKIAFTTEVLLFQAARAQIYNEVVLPALAAGKIVLMDRTRDSSVIYQGIVRKFGKELIEQLNTISTHDTYPNVTFLLDVTVETGMNRKAGSGDMDRIDFENKDFHQEVKEAYIALAKEDKTGRWHIIDAEQHIDEIEKEMWKIVSEKLSLKSPKK